MPRSDSDSLDCSKESSINHISNISAIQSPRNNVSFEEQQQRQHQQTYYAVDTVSQAAAIIMSHYNDHCNSSKTTKNINSGSFFSNNKQQSAASRLLAPPSQSVDNDSDNGHNTHQSFIHQGNRAQQSPQSVRRSLDMLLDGASSVSSSSQGPGSSGRPSLDELLGNWPQHPAPATTTAATTAATGLNLNQSHLPAVTARSVGEMLHQINLENHQANNLFGVDPQDGGGKRRSSSRGSDTQPQQLKHFPRRTHSYLTTDDGWNDPLACPSTTATITSSNIAATKSSSTATGGAGAGVSARSNTKTAGVASSLVDTSSLFKINAGTGGGAGAGGGRSTKLPTLTTQGSAALNNNNGTIGTNERLTLADYYKYIRDGDADDKDSDYVDPAIHDTFGAHAGREDYHYSAFGTNTTSNNNSRGYDGLSAAAVVSCAAAMPAPGGQWQMPPSPKLTASTTAAVPAPGGERGGRGSCASSVPSSGHSTPLLSSSPGLTGTSTTDTLSRLSAGGGGGGQSSQQFSQPSVTLRGGNLTSVPPLHVLRARKQTREALFRADSTPTGSPATTTIGSAALQQQEQQQQQRYTGIHSLYASKYTSSSSSSSYKSTSSTTNGSYYISEAKKVLGQAMQSLPSHEAGAAKSDVSPSGAIGPLIRYLHTNAQSNASTAVIAPTVHTLTLLVSNAPNREVVVGLQGLHALLAVLRSPQQQKKEGIAVREDVMQLLWDLDGVERKAPLQAGKDVLPLLGVLRDTLSPVTAHQALHFLSVCLCCEKKTAHQEVEEEDEDSNNEVQEQEEEEDYDECLLMRTAADQLVREIVAHKHRLQDAAQYALGSLLAKLLGDRSLVSLDLVNIHIKALLLELKRCSIVSGISGEEMERNDASSQGQLLLTVLSVMASNGRLRAALTEGHARRVVAAFGQRATVEGLKTRAMSLAKVLHKEEMMHASDVWYFG
jgi:hypothetical protein